jgi:moderate conductance mechanosensitive channel
VSLGRVIGQGITISLRSVLNLTLVGLLAATLLTAWVPNAVGESPLWKIWQQQLHQPDRSVQRLGGIEATPVHFDGTELFTLASPAVWDRTEPGPQTPVEVRARQVESNLNQVIEGSFIHGNKDGVLTNFDPKTLQVSVMSLNDVPVIIASDSYHSQPSKLVTVTYIDADYNGQPAAALAEQWRALVYQNLYGALMERSPDALSLRGKLGEALVGLGLTLAGGLVIWLLQLPLRRRNRRLRLQQTALAAEVTPDFVSGLATDLVFESAPERSGQGLGYTASEQELIALRAAFIDVFQRQRQLQTQRNVVSGFRWLLAWGQVAIWSVGLATALSLFPWTRHYVPNLLGTPADLLLIWFVTSAVNRLIGGLLNGMAETWVKFSHAADPKRDGLRIFTILATIKPIKTFCIYSCGLVAAAVHLGMPFSLVLTIAGIVGLAVLLIFQDFVRDWAAGLLILWGDQYAIGDVIQTENQIGLVERLDPRLTQLWDTEGRLISIANRSINRVENLTRGWLQREQREASSPKAERGSRLVTTASANPFNGSDPFNGIDPFSNDSNETTVN